MSKTDAATIMILDIGTSTMSRGNSFILGSKVKVTRHQNIAGIGFCILVSAGFL